MLGFDSNRTYDGHDVYTLEYPACLNEGTNLVYVYCDLLEQVLVGDTKAPLLRIINRNSSTNLNAVSHAKFNPVQYDPLQKTYFDTVAVKLMTDVGERMPIVAGKSILVIEFRRCAHLYLSLLQAVDPSGEGSATRVLLLHSARFVDQPRPTQLPRPLGV